MTTVKGELNGENTLVVTEMAMRGNSVGLSGKGDVNGVQAEGGANGVLATGKGWCGVVGISESTSGGFGVYGENIAGGTGVVGVSKKWIGVYGETSGLENGPAGVWGEHKGAGIGVKAISNTGVGLVAFSHGTAAIFQGDVEVTGDIRLTNADCAEDFTIGVGIAVEPGTVMVVGENGALFPSQQPYDKRVAGVISGAGDYKPGIVLDKQQSELTRQPIALVGKAFCKVDARYGAVEVGDLLTTSPTAGHAMKASDSAKAPGAVIGKALRPLSDGQGLIPILIALQ
jgi:hypothetical protein